MLNERSKPSIEEKTATIGMGSRSRKFWNVGTNSDEKLTQGQRDINLDSSLLIFLDGES